MSLNTFLAICVAIFSIAVALPERTLYASAPVDRGAYYVRGKNVYNYGYNTGDGTAKVEARHPDGSVTGSYRYFDPHGRQIVRSYIADKKGFRVLGNALPVAPDTPAVGILREETLYGATEGTGDDSTGNNDLTSSFLLSNQLGSASETSSSFDRRSTVSEEHRSIISQQDSLIQQYERQLEELKSQRDRLQRQYSQPQFKRQNSAHEQHSSVNPLGGIYFYHDRKRDYDFPAGFAYASPQPVQARTRSQSAKDLLVIDDGSSSNVAYRPLYRRRSDRVKW